MRIFRVTNKALCELLRHESALTIEGLTLESVDDLKRWINQHTKLLNEFAYVIKGEAMNRWYGLTGTNAYPDDLNIVCIDLNDIENVAAIVVPRFAIGGRWLDDVIDNNLRREGVEEPQEDYEDD